MASLPRAQYKLPAVQRSIADLGDFYGFGTALTKRDMSPLGHDRVINILDAYETMPLNLKGSNAAIVRSTSAANAVGVNAFGAGWSSSFCMLAGAQSLFGLNAQGGVFESKSGTTAGQKFTAVGGSIYRILDNGELERLNATSAQLSSETKGFTEHLQIVAESATRFYVHLRCSLYWSGSSSSNTSSSYIQRDRFLVVVKSSGALGFMAPLSGSTGRAPGTTNPSAPDSNQSTVSANKAYRHLTTLEDGRLLFIRYPTEMDGLLAPTQRDIRLMALDPSADTASASSAFMDAARYVFGVPSPMLPRVPADTSGRGSWYLPRPTGVSYDILAAFVSLTLPADLSNTPAIPVSRACTISDMPAGVSLTCPSAASLPGATSGSRAQVSTWFVREGDVDHLVCFSHGNGAMGFDTEAFAPVANHQMVVFKIDEVDPTKLIYKWHNNGAFDYGQVLTQFVASADFKTVIVFNALGFGILTWNATLSKYVASPFRGIPSGITRLSLDTSGQIWVEDVDAKVYVFNLDLSATVDVSYVGNPANILYSGTTIEQEVDVDAFSFAGSRVQRSIRLVLKGAAFEDGTVQRVIVSSTSAPTRVKIFINGTGNVDVTARLE